MIPVAEALSRVFDLVRPLGAEHVPLRVAAGRVLAEPVIAKFGQPPFPASSMDGYAVPTDDPAPGDRFDVIGESAAGHGFAGRLSAGQAVRIFTGAPVPEGGARVVIQEDVTRDGEQIVLREDLDPRHYIRPAGADFAAGTPFAPRRPLRPADIALIAAMGHGEVALRRRPEIGLIATGDELVMPGETPGPDQIVASNTFGLAAMIEAAGGIARMLPIACDTEASLEAVLDLAAGADLIVTVGGASVGDHDLVAKVAEARGMERAFYKVAMRPGKPLMAGRIGGIPMIGLPGNPVSAMVCGMIFVLPMMRVMLGLPAEPAPRRSVRLAIDMPANGPREHYMRARLDADGVTPFDSQDSARLGILSAADALIVRPPHDPARNKGEPVDIVEL
ncbi:molybdopterin molybdotransferase [Palleronia marisminoris]|uniref:Molybdopterin molybdenumtransferase n=1 Tax=Palleronia marisminoris TaxID=315423 RepID=A0A1Y5RGX8_9RHOB|nr:gephyrin-like molybdotransferase Glp [Palleronia marisminoris]SFG19370.1 molybdopterin molybdotransferase [Palleronia marisminoris]SLN17188.1 Molybdopterin molybdenumtransferase [Palleronia marisminoris]